MKKDNKKTQKQTKVSIVDRVVSAIKNVATKGTELALSKAKQAHKISRPALAASAILAAVIALPRLHTLYIRNYVGDSVVMLTNRLPDSGEPYGGGTGFHITAASGKTIVISNRHVCMAGKDQGFMYGAVRGKTGYHKLKIVELYSNSDLCVLEPISGVSPLKLGSSPTEGQSVWAVGHPNLQPRTVTKGEVQGFEWMTFAVGAIGYMNFSEEDCRYQNRFSVPASKEKLGIKAIFGRTDLLEDLISGPGSPQDSIKICVERDLSMITTIPIYKGNSGSPVVDDFGRVVSVIFATNSDQMWGQAITIFDLKKLLAKY